MSPLFCTGQRRTLRIRRECDAAVAAVRICQADIDLFRPRFASYIKEAVLPDIADAVIVPVSDFCTERQRSAVPAHGMQIKFLPGYPF